MNGPTAEEPVWERSWSLEEIGKSSQSWSLGADAGLLNFLREFSQQTISRTHEIEKRLDGLIREAKATDCRLHNVFNDFLMLSNTQFIENRVYDEEVEEHVVKSDPGDKLEQEKTREQKEAELIPKVQEAVRYGLQVLETAFEQLDIKAGNSDSEEEELNERVELILEPKDLYIDRPLPYLIGSELFMQQEDVGLGDLSSEEGSVDNDRGSIIDSEEEEEKDEEESEDDLGNNSEEKKLHTALSDEDEDSGSDLFDSDKEEDEENDKLMKTRPTSFADELAARIQGDIPTKQETNQASKSSLEVKTKKEKREANKDPSDDEDDIFKPPKLTDEDFSPFGSKGGLFSGGMGLFDDDEEGLFADVQNEEHRQKEPSPVINSEPSPSSSKKKVPVGGVSLFPGGGDVIGSSILADREKKKPPTPTVDTTPKLPTSTSLFEDDLFVGSNAKQSAGNSVKAKPAPDLFADDLFEDELSLPPPAINKEKETKNLQVPTEKSKPPESSIKKTTRGLFSDEDDSETDLFFPSQSASKSKATLPATKAAKALSFFDDEEDLFGSALEKKPAVPVKPTQQTTLPAESKIQKSNLLFSSGEVPTSLSNKTKPVEQSQTKKDAALGPPEKEVKAEKMTSLFDEVEEEDLFAITKESHKKHHRVSLLFEDDQNSEGSLFASVTPATPAVQASQQAKTLTPATPGNNGAEKESLFEDSEKKAEVKKDESVAPISVSENKEPSSLQKNVKVKQFASPELGDLENDDLFAASPPPDQYTKIKTKNVLSLFEDEEDGNVEDQLAIINTQKESRKSSHTKSTGVFQDEELLFSRELQKDNDPDVDLFASTKKQSEKSNPAKLSSGMGLFSDEEEDDLFSTTKPKKPPKVEEKKTVIRREGSDTSKEISKVSEAKPDIVKVVKPRDAETPTGPASIKTKGSSSRIGKLQANLLINPATMLPGAVPKLPGARPAVPGLSVLAPPCEDLSSIARSPTTSKSAEEGVSFANPAEVDTLNNVNKTRAKVAGKRRPPSRAGRKLSPKDAGETEDLIPASAVSYKTDTKSAEADPSQSNPGKLERAENISTMKLSLSESDVQYPTNTKVLTKPLTPNVNDLFGSEDLFGKNSLSKPAVSRSKKASPDNFTSRPGQAWEKKSSVLVLDEEGSDDDLFQTLKQKSTKALKPTVVPDNEVEDNLFGSQKTPKKMDVLSIPQKDANQSITSNIFEDDIFATEALKPVKKAKEKKQSQEPNLFDDNLDIFADLTVKTKEKKTKKKVEQPKSIFDDDMDDIFSSGNQKKPPKPKVKSSQATEAKLDGKVFSAFDDPLNVFGK
ncbi:WASH complex subunit 2C isoform X3 [Ascaphus truei]|uniref:WASH complex subunit 2C isoform X3 n=1 Tax=Ascaphus truei TaxID=8439 RepID=UPI003F59C212